VVFRWIKVDEEEKKTFNGLVTRLRVDHCDKNRSAHLDFHPSFRSVAMSFVDFRFCFRYFQKLMAKFWFRLNRFKILKF